MFIATHTRETVRLPGGRLGTVLSETETQTDIKSKIYLFGTPQQLDALSIESLREPGYYRVQTKVRAAPMLDGIAPGGLETDTYKAIEFGTRSWGYFGSSIYAVTPKHGQEPNGLLSISPRHSKLQPIFFCTEIAPYLTRFLTAVWEGVDTGVETANLVKEVAKRTAIVTGALGAAFLGAKTRTVTGTCLGGVAGAIGGVLIGGIMGYTQGKSVTRAREHDVALRLALGIFIRLSASEGKSEDTNDATDSLTELMAAHHDKKGTPFDTACQEVMQYIDMLELRARHK
jgi:hypothetical protein